MRHLNRVLLLCACATVAQANVIVPNGLSGIEGGGNNNFPFDSINPQRYQQVFAASEFGNGGLITQIAFRPDGIVGKSFLLTIGNIQIDLSTTLAAPDGLNSTFATNVGADSTIAFSGSLTLSSSFTGPAGGPMAFDIIINLTTPFLYNPHSGNLLLDVRNFSGTPSGLAGGFDSQFTLGDSISSAYGDVGSTTASVIDTEGLVTQFGIVPEAGTIAMLAIGSLLIVGGSLRRRRG
jgi:hypothetical protein